MKIWYFALHNRKISPYLPRNELHSVFSRKISAYSSFDGSSIKSKRDENLILMGHSKRKARYLFSSDYKAYKKRKPCISAGSFYIPSLGQKAKGEEKPEEELMGKRKSSPRLATTSSN